MANTTARGPRAPQIGRTGADNWASVCDLGTTWSRLPQTTAASRGLGFHFVMALPTTGNGQTVEGRGGLYTILRNEPTVFA